MSDFGLVEDGSVAFPTASTELISVVGEGRWGLAEVCCFVGCEEVFESSFLGKNGSTDTGICFAYTDAGPASWVLSAVLFICVVSRPTDTFCSTLTGACLEGHSFVAGGRSPASD